MIVKLGEKVYSKIFWEEIDYGDVCEFTSKDGCGFIGMKVDSSLGEDFVLDLDDSKIYTDFKNYTIVRVIKNATLVELE